MEYTELVATLKAPAFGLRGIDPDILHAAMGISTEAGEIMDALKKSMAYGKPLDTLNLKEEIGDCLFYLTLLCIMLGTTLEAELDRNMSKLLTRYGNKFDEGKALNRDLDKEREVLNVRSN